MIVFRQQPPHKHVQILELLKTDTIVTQIDLSGIVIGWFELCALVDVVKINTTLVRIDINYNNNNGTCDDMLTILAESLRCNSTLETIDFQDSSFKSHGLAALSNSLAVNSTITSIALTGNKFDRENMEELARGMIQNKSIQTLHLPCNNVQDDGIIALANMFTMNQHITNIDLSLNKIDKKGMQMLTDALAINTTLTRINLSHNKMTNTMMLNMIDLPRVNKTIQYIDVLQHGNKSLIFQPEDLDAVLSKNRPTVLGTFSLYNILVYF